MEVGLVIVSSLNAFTIGTNDKIGYNTSEDQDSISATFVVDGADDWVAKVDLSNDQVTPVFQN